MLLCQVLRAAAGSWAACALVLGSLAACGGEGEVAAAAGSAATAVPDTASDAGAQVARRIVKAATLPDAVTATREALARGGLTVTDFAGNAQPAVGAASPFVVLPRESVVLAYEARRRATHSRLTLADLGAMLNDFGWAFEGEGMPGEQLMSIVATWVRAAQQAPDDPLNFTPLFLADMGRRQVPAVDLANDSTNPHHVRLSLLEVQLIAAALTRGLAPPAEVAVTPAQPAGPASPTPDFPKGSDLQTASYGAIVIQRPGPCADAKKWFGETLPGQAMAIYGGWGVGEALEGALGAAGLSAANVKKLTRSLDAIGIAMKIVKLAQLYASGEITLDYASESPAHRPAPGVDKTASVVARAGVDPEDWKEYQESINSADAARSVRDCLDTFGLPSWSDMSEIAADAESWRVRWLLGRGSPKHALHQIAGNEWRNMGNRTMLLRRISPTSAEAKYTFKLTEEWRAGHPGKELKGEVEVTAELQTAEPPGVSTFTDAMFGIMGLVKSLVDLGIGWFQTVVTPESTIVVPITYHDDGIHIFIEDESDVSLEFCMAGDCANGGPAMFRAGTSERSRHIYAGTIRLGDDSLWHGNVVLTSTGTYTIPDPHAGDDLAAGMEGGEASLEDVAEALKLLSDVPRCSGKYEGYQILAVEGSYVTNEWGATRVELALIPVNHWEDFSTTPSCPWEHELIDGFAMVPNRLVQPNEGTAFTIEPPKPGERKVYLERVNVGGVMGSTKIVVGESFR